MAGASTRLKTDGQAARFIGFKTSPPDARAILAAAEEAGQNISEWIRDACMRQVIEQQRDGESLFPAEEAA